MPAVVTARNTPDTHNTLETGPFSETVIMQMEDTRVIDYVTFILWVLVLAVLSLP